MALSQPALYAQHVRSAHAVIAAFGGSFLLLIFLSFLLDAGKEIHWLGWFEAKLALVGKLDYAAVIVALAAVLGAGELGAPDPARAAQILGGGLAGILVFAAVKGAGNLLSSSETATGLRRGLIAFLYLELLDATFSFDGVMGAFAITQQIVLIAIGLGIGAMFIRSLTLLLVRKGTLAEYVYLEHGAHYAIGALAAIMLLGTSPAFSLPEPVTGLVGVVFIGLAMGSSLWERNRAIREEAPGSAGR